MRAQRRLVSPLLEEEQPHRVLAVDMHIMRDAARLPARALDMLKARMEHLVESILARDNAARYQNHAFPPLRSGPHPAVTRWRRGGLIVRQCIRRGTTAHTANNTPRLPTTDTFIRAVLASVIGSTKKKIIAKMSRP
jgi:hypothetical protein